VCVYYFEKCKNDTPGKESVMRHRIRLLAALLLFVGLMVVTAGATGSATSRTDPNEEVTLEITIRHSGLFSRKTTVIRYRKSDKAIIAVRENGKEVPEEKLEEYRQLLGEALEVSELQDLIPELDAVNRTFESVRVPDTEKFRELQGVMRKLDGLESEFARTQMELMRVRQKLIKYEVAIDEIQMELERNDIDLAKNSEIVIRDRWLYVDDERMPRELSERCIAIFEEITGEKMESHGTALQWKR